MVTDLLQRLQKNDRKIRAFGEMVALLWEQGLNGATVQLENLWNQLHKKSNFTLFCAYPKIRFTQDINHSMDIICSAHTKVINGQPFLQMHESYDHFSYKAAKLNLIK